MNEEALVLGMVTALLTIDGSRGDLLGIANSDMPKANDLYTVSTENASMQLIGLIIPRPEGPMNSLELAPNGMYFGATDNIIMKVDPDAGTAEEFLFAGQEGILTGLDFSPAGFGYVTNSPPGGFETEFKTFDPDTAEVLGAGSIDDLNFLEVAFRSDGILLGIDSDTNDVWQVDPFTGDVEFMFSLAPGIGTVLALTTLGDESFLLAWEGFEPDSPRKLYDFDLYTGETTLIGQIDPNVSLVGLALVPSPAGASVLALAGAVIARRRR